MGENRYMVVDPTQFHSFRRDLAYASQSPSQVLDIAYPDGEGPFPLIVFVHGGGFSGGRKDEFTIAFVFKLVSQGYAVASVEYRRALEAPWPAQIHDVKAAIRWLKAHGEELNLKTDRLLMCGNSAGGALTQMTAATSATHQLEDLSMGNAEYDSMVDAIISWYGPCSMEDELLVRKGLTHEEYARVTIMPVEAYEGYPEPLSAPDLLLHKKAIDHLDEVHQLSPYHYVDSTFVPALFQHGTADPVVDYSQSLKIAEKINENCGVGRAVVELFPGGTHGDPAIKTNENMLRCAVFANQFVPSRRIGAPMPSIRLIEAQ